MADAAHIRKIPFPLPLLLLTAAVLFAAVLLTIIATAVADAAARDTQAAVVAEVASRYPDAETAVIENMQHSDPLQTAAGYAILQKYGMGGAILPGNGVSARLLAFLLPAWGTFAVLLCAAFLLLFHRARRRDEREIHALTLYLRRIRSGDYTLDLRDNREGAFSIFKNELYKITVALREQSLALQTDKARLGDAIADISHQIKTPLTALSVLADLLAGDPPEDMRRTFVGKLRAQLDRIEWLVSTLLKLSRLDTGTAALKKEAVPLRDMAERAAEPLRAAAEIRDVKLRVAGNPSASFTGDRNWTVEALGNVLKNCIEHTGPGGRVTVACDANPLYASFTVSDTGEGIAPEDLPHIFTRFYRGKNADENSVGIGLAMAKAVIVRQNGDIRAESTPGTGTTFHIRFYRGNF